MKDEEAEIEVTGNRLKEEALGIKTLYWAFHADSQIQSSFFATVNQMLGGSSLQLPTTAERAVIKSNRCIFERSSDNIVGSREEPLNI